MNDCYEIHAIRYGYLAGRTLSQVLIGGLAGEQGERQVGVAYHVFVLKGPGGPFVFDTGADRAAMQARGRDLTVPLGEGLAELGVDPAGAGVALVQTHLHWDHAGNHDLLGAARVHLQRREMAYAATRGLADPWLRAGYDAADIARMAARIAAGQVALHDGDVVLGPGLSLHHVGGHTDGLMLARVRTRRGWMVLAGDAVAYRENLARRTPFPHLFHVGDALAAFDRARALADHAALVIPGHDPEITPELITRLD
ncbi:MAG: N-acyl homoserine lactonase family protein [Acetobacteraceae bacterium]|nr:N-acyl homoserine lactonase family protein [Acetobacteraceae bacterium]